MEAEEVRRVVVVRLLPLAVTDGDTVALEDDGDLPAAAHVLVR